MYRHFNQNFGYNYSLEAFAGIGQLYVYDSRFTANIDQYGEGLSKFLAEAMGIYAKKSLKSQSKQPEKTCRRQVFSYPRR